MHMHAHTLIQTQWEHQAKWVLCLHVQHTSAQEQYVGGTVLVYKGPEPSPGIQEAWDWEAWGPQDKVHVTKSPSISQTTGFLVPLCAWLSSQHHGANALQHNINTRAVKETSLRASNLKSLNLLQLTRWYTDSHVNFIHVLSEKLWWPLNYRFTFGLCTSGKWMQIN